MASKPLNLVHPSDAHTENVVAHLKAYIVDGKKTGGPYIPSKVAVRDKVKYWTAREDKDQAWQKKFCRQDNNFASGHFSDKSRPYKPLGDLCLEVGDLLLDCATDEVRLQLKDVPHFKKVDVKQWKVPILKSSKKLLKLSPITSPIKCGQPSPGLSALLERISEVNEMRRLVISGRSIKEYFQSEKQCNLDEDVLKTLDHAHPPHFPINSLKRSVQHSAHNEDTRFRRTNNLKSTSIPSRRRQTALQEIVPEWKKKLKLLFINEKLRAINTLLCAIFNMKTKSVKQQSLIPHKRVYNLLRSKVELDDFGKPRPWKPTRHSIAENFQQSSSCSSQVSSYELTSISKLPFGKKASFGDENTRGYCSTKSIRSPTKLSQLTGKSTRRSSDLRIETWEDLIGNGEKQSKQISIGNQKPAIRRRFNVVQMATESSAPWINLSVTENVVREKKERNFMDEPSFRTAEDIMRETKEDFLKLQVDLNVQMEAECKKQRKNQYQFLKYKFESVKFGARMHHLLDEMRLLAKEKVKQRNQSFIQPSKWFTELKTEVLLALEGQLPEEVKQLLQELSKFQFENDVSMPFAKEKLCLLVMSMPAHLLLPESMTDAIVFILERILDSLPELFHCWLIRRRLDKITNIEKYSSQLKVQITE